MPSFKSFRSGRGGFVLSCYEVVYGRRSGTHFQFSDRDFFYRASACNTYRARYCFIVISFVRPSVRLSVCLSDRLSVQRQYSISKRMHISLYFFHGRRKMFRRGARSEGNGQRTRWGRSTCGKSPSPWGRGDFFLSIA